MRIALAIMSLQQAGGAEHDVLHLSAGLRRAGHEPLVITEGGRLQAEIEAQGVPVVHCPLHLRSPRALYENARRLADIIEDHGVDVLNPQSIHPAVSGYWATRRVLRRGRFVPNVVTIHMLQDPSWRRYKLGALALNRVADHVIFESSYERRRLARGGLTAPATVVPSSTPPDRLLAVREERAEIRLDLGWPDDRVVFLMPARLSHEKGHDTVLRALSRPELCGRPILLYLAGDGPLTAPTQRLARELCVEGQVVFGGFRRDLPRLYRAADAFVLASRSESLPLSIREAMAAALPVVATSVGGVAEAVEHGASGLLVAPDDPAELARAMAALAGDPARRRRMGLRGHAIYGDRFNYDRWIDRTIEVMSAITGRPVGPAGSSAAASRPHGRG